VDSVVLLVQVVSQAYRVLKDIQVCFVFKGFSWLNYVRIYYLGDAGEPGIGGGYGQPGIKGQSGMCLAE
jgi:hypothetical protein